MRVWVIKQFSLRYKRKINILKSFIQKIYYYSEIKKNKEQEKG